jgi:protein SCO1/2
VPAHAVLADQDGRVLTLSDYSGRRPSILAFYTRCDTPNMCSLTITKLSRLQGMLHARVLHGRINTAAITYDRGCDCRPG